MLPLSKADLSRVRAVFTDVDGTLTSNGQLAATTLNAIEALTASKVPVVLVSGRPSGWGECWARQLPVAAVIVENGGLTYVRRRGELVKLYAEPEGLRQRRRRALERHVDAAIAHVRGTRRSMDSIATEVDLAIDYAEDVQLGPRAADRLEQFLTARGVTAVRSSVHVNCWLGPFDKRTAVESFLRSEWQTALSRDDRRFIYVGDSFNDQPLFEAFGLSVGVANVRKVKLEQPPKFVTMAAEGDGFQELAHAVLRARRRKARQ